MERLLTTTTVAGALAMSLALDSAYALPVDGQVRGGQARMASRAGRTTVTQSSERAVIDWSTFNVAQGETVQFVQPNASAITLNRISDVNPSVIDGTITANGQVWLVSANGIAFGKDAQVNVGGLLATSSDITNADFMDGNYSFSHPGNATAAISNAGSLSAVSGGLIALAGPNVSNTGLITAHLGKVQLASGDSFTVDLYGDGLINLQASPAITQQLVSNSGTIDASGGQVLLTAAAAETVLGSLVNLDGLVSAAGINVNGALVSSTATLDASTASGAGGQIAVTGSQGIVAGGTMSADGSSGGSVTLSAPSILHYGTITVQGTAGAGGTVTLDAGGTIQQTTASLIDASGTGAGGSIAISAGAGSGSSLYSSGTYRATGSTGGSITITGDQLALVAAALDVSGAQGGGTVLIGGASHGGGTLQQASTTNISPATTIDADATDNGNGGNVVIWSSGQTQFYGTISASGGPNGGNGGAMEVSSADLLTFGGFADGGAPRGTAGSLLLDPRNITISTGAPSAGSYIQLVDPNSSTDYGGNSLVVLSGGNIVVTDPYATVSGVSEAGGVYLFNGTTGALISELVGSHASDNIGLNGITMLTGNGNYVIASPTWNNYEGAVTWGNGTSGISGIVSSSNSLVGSTSGTSSTGDQVGAGGITVLSNGNYAVDSYAWSGGTANGKGAVTWGSGASGVSGVVSSSNSLVGSHSKDLVGSGGILLLTGNGNYVVDSPYWNSYEGAVTWGSGASGISGVVSSSNSLVGSTSGTASTGDQVGSYDGIESILFLSNGNYVVQSPDWSGGSANGKGAVTWGSGASGVSGVVSSANSLVGSHSKDFVGIEIDQLIGNGNYVVDSDTWNSYEGAVTWGNGTSGVSGIVSSSNSLVGSTSGTATTGDEVGGGTITVLSNGNYVVQSPDWSGGSANGKGAVTWGSGASGVSGVVSSSNSLVGSHSGDFVGSGGIYSLTGNGNYVVDSDTWNSYEGAVTWGSGSSGVSGVVSSSNSLVGSTTGTLSTGDMVGDNGLLLLSNGNYVVLSFTWSGGTTNGKGAVTWGSGASGVSGVVSSANSLVGSHNGDFVGGGWNVALIGNGNYVIAESGWNSYEGAVTWGSGASGVSGVVSSSNSLVGSTSGTPSTGDEVGAGGITALSNGNYVVNSDDWSGGTTNGKGAVTWGSGASGVSGVVSSSNSLVGSHSGDHVGHYGITRLTGNGNYVVDSPYWNSYEGAVTWGSGTSGVSGIVSSSNSLVGSTSGTSSTGDMIGDFGITALSDGNYVVDSPYWSGGSTSGYGAVTWGSGASGVSGVVSSSNSLVGSHSGDLVGGVLIGANGVYPLAGNGNYVVVDSNWNSYEGAVTWGSGSSGVTGIVSSSNSLIGSTTGTSSTGDQVGYDGILALSDGNYVVESPYWSGGSTNGYGAVTWGSGVYGVTGVVSSANSLAGSHSGDQIGSGGVADVGNGDFLISTPDYNGDVGRIDLFLDDSTPNQLYAIASGTDVTINVAAITAITGTGTAVTLQANNDITLAASSNIVSTGNGAITFEAGNSIILDSSITTDNGNLTLLANDTAADGVVNADRLSGASVITMANGTTLNTGTGALSITIGTGAGNTNNSSGDITLYGLNAGALTVANNGPSNGNIWFNGALTLGGTGSVTTGGGNVTFASTVDGAHGLTVNASSGAALFDSAVGGGTALSSLSVTGATTLDGNVTTTGAQTYNSAVTLGGNDTLATANSNVTFASTVNGAYGLTVAAGSGSVAFDSVVGNSAALASLAVTGPTALDGNVTTTGSQTYNSAVTLGGSDTLSSGSAATTFGSTVNGDYDLTATAGSFSFGGAWGGTTPLAAVSLTSANAMTLPAISAASISGQTTGASADLTLSGQITASGTGTPVVLASGRNFINDAGSGVINLTGGSSPRWLIYSTNQDNDTPDGLAAANSLYGQTYASYPPGNVTQSVNTWIYAQYLGTLDVSANVQSITYGQTIPTLTYGCTGGGCGGLSGALTSSGGSAGATPNAGSYAITQGTLAENGWQIDFTGSTLTVGTASLTITASNISGTYGSVSLNGTTGFTATGLVGGQTVGSVALSTNATTSTSGNYNVSGGTPWTITPSAATGGTFNPANYSITYDAATTGMTVTPLAVTVASGVTANNKVYDATTADTLSFSTPTLSGVIGDDVVSINQSTGNGAFANANVGNGKTVTASGLGLTDADAGDYTLTQPTGLTANVTPASLTVAARNVSMTYADGTTLNDTTGFTASGLLGSDSVSSVTLTTNAATSGSGNWNAGTWTITPSAAVGAGLSNYTVTYSTGTQIINPKSVSINGVTASNKVYDGTTADTLNTGSESISGKVAGDNLTISNGTGSFITANAGGGITVDASGFGLAGADAGDYVLAGQPPGLSASIAQAVLTVTASSGQGKTYGAADPTLTYSYSGLVGTDTSSAFSGSLIRAAGEDAGSYAITQGTLSAGSNYAISYNAANFTISPATLTVIADDPSKLYGAAMPSLTFTYSGLVGGDTNSVFSGALTTPADASSKAGTYAISQGSLTAGSNYTISFTPGTLTINKAALTIAANDQSMTYGAPVPALTARFTGLVNGDTSAVVSGLRLSATGGSSGTYSITPSDASAANYVISYADGTLTVNPALLTVMADNKSRAQGSPNPPLTFRYSGLENGDISSVFVGALTTAANINSPAGSYAIRQGTLSAGINYLINYMAGFLTVTPAAAQEAAPPRLAASTPQIVATLGQANNYINPVMILDRPIIEPISIIYLGGDVIMNGSSPSAGPGMDFVSTLRRSVIDSGSIISCDEAHDIAFSALCAAASAAANTSGATK